MINDTSSPRPSTLALSNVVEDELHTEQEEDVEDDAGIDDESGISAGWTEYTENEDALESARER